jgi:uncharacterized protein
MSWINDSPRGAVLSVRVVPRSSRNRIDGVHGDALKVRLQAPPVEGKANAALAELLADSLGVSASSVILVRGDTGRNKSLLVAGLRAAEARARLGVQERMGTPKQ